MDYNKTINLPKTDFPMRAGLPNREPDMLQHWNDLDLYNELLKKNEGKPLFSLHDGPPFSNGGLHMGHALNKSIKDFITRTYAMRGYYTPYIPGWDNHGMPIESAIIKEQKLNHKEMTTAEFRDACHAFAQHYVDVQREQFKRLGCLGEWDHPYLTMDPKFEAEEIRIFGKMYEKGYIYRGKKPVYWCPHDETALAEAEIEYKDVPCTSIYVKFKVKDDLGRLSGLDLDKTYFVIWTTTTWTLPGNLAIALHPDETYALVGVVSTVGLNWCTVLTIVDTDTSLGAQVFRTNDLGLAVGDFSLMRENRLRLDYLPADCQLLGGDLVVTSGLGGYYPPDLSIGTVEEVQLSDSGASSYAVLVPEADFDQLVEVFVIKSFDIQT